MLVRPLGDAVALSPPLTISREEVGHLAEVVGDSLDALVGAAV